MRGGVKKAVSGGGVVIIAAMKITLVCVVAAMLVSLSPGTFVVRAAPAGQACPTSAPDYWDCIARERQRQRERQEDQRRERERERERRQERQRQPIPFPG